jgi:hypothetical protein
VNAAPRPAIAAMKPEQERSDSYLLGYTSGRLETIVEQLERRQRSLGTLARDMAENAFLEHVLGLAREGVAIAQRKKTP